MSSQSYLKIIYFDEIDSENINDGFDEKKVLPFADSPIFYAPVKYLQELSRGDNVKTTYKLGLDIKYIDQDFLPGDTIGILPENNEILIKDILLRLNLETVAEKLCKLEICEETSKKNPSIPKHLPTKTTQIQEIFAKYIDVNTPPKKLFLKSLVKFTNDLEEIKKLEQISSPKSGKEYSEFIANEGRSLLGLLNAFPSCRPPIEILLEHLPPLQPRPYSIASSPLQKQVLDLVFFVMVHDDGRKGLCTGWLEENCLKDDKKIAFYFRKSTAFRIPQNFSLPMILVATGTGIAPFRGFLQHRSFLKSQKIKLGECWLFYGCRYSKRDFLFRDEIHKYLKDGIINKLEVAFSREGDRYIQHKIEDNAGDIYSWINESKTCILICGNPQTTIKEVKDCLIKTFVNIAGMAVEEAELYMGELQKIGRYLIDTWI